jgi:hypothetical protein
MTDLHTADCRSRVYQMKYVRERQTDEDTTRSVIRCPEATCSVQYRALCLHTPADGIHFAHAVSLIVSY